MPFVRPIVSEQSARSNHHEWESEKKQSIQKLTAWPIFFLLRASLIVTLAPQHACHEICPKAAGMRTLRNHRIFPRHYYKTPKHQANLGREPFASFFFFLSSSPSLSLRTVHQPVFCSIDSIRLDRCISLIHESSASFVRWG